MNLSPLRQTNFRLLWCAGLISTTGDWALRIALPIYVLRLAGTPAAVSSVVLAGLVASLLFGPVAGAYVDRWDRRTVLVVTNAVQVLVLLPLLAVDTADRIWIVTAVAFAESTVSQFFGPAENALLPRLVSADQLAAANSLNSLNNHIGRLVGPAVGGLVTAAMGLTGAAIVDGCTFLAAAVLCARITGGHRPDRPDRRRLLRELADGVVSIGRNRITRAIAVFVTITAVGEGMMLTLFAVYITRALHVGGREMGWLLSAQAVGGITGSLAGTRVANRFRPVGLVSTCMALFGLGDLAIFNYPRWDTALWPVMGMFFLIGVAGGIGYAAMMTLLQNQTPDGLRGRVFAVIAVGQAVAAMLGAALAGALGEAVNVIDLLTAQGAGYLLAGVLLRMLAGRGPAPLAPLAPLASRSP